MSYLMRARPGSYSRTCDVCARPRPIDAFRVVDNLYICSFHPGYIPARVLDKIPYREFGPPKPPKDLKPFQTVPVDEAVEADIFNFIYTNALVFNSFSLTGSSLPTALSSPSVVSMAAAGIYLGNLIIDGTRPAGWLARAEERLIEIGDRLAALQSAGPSVGGSSSDSTWGAFGDGLGGTAHLGGLALLRAYQITGKSKYLDAARATAWFMRSLQCSHVLVSSSDTKYRGMWSYGTSQRYFYALPDLQGLEFLKNYLAVAGDEVIGSPTVTATFASSRKARVSTCIADAKAFWLDGQYDVSAGAVVRGLSTSRIYQSYDGTTNLWDTETTFASGTVTLGLRGLWSVDGESTLVAALFDQLMAYSSNPAYELPSQYDDRLIFEGNMGTYDPTFCIAASIDTAGRKNAETYYQFSNLGHLAELYSSRQRAAFAATKVTLSTPTSVRRRGTEEDGRRVCLGIIHGTGLSLQPVIAGGILNDLASVAALGNIYRQAPRAYGRATARTLYSVSA